MRHRTLPTKVIMMLAVAVGVILAWQYQTARQLRDEIGLLRGQDRRLRQLEDDHRRLSAEQVASGELQALRDDHAAAVRLRGEVEAFKARVEEMTPMVVSPQPVALLPLGAWKNAGRATPVAAVETLLWAVAGGDTDTMAGGIILDPAARTKAEAQLAQLPEAMRREYGTPEKFVALLLARSAAPIKELEVISQTPIDADTTALQVRMKDGEGKTKETVFMFQKSTFGWQLKVPANGLNK